LKISFDALTLASVCSEVSEMIGGKCQGIRQPDDHTVVLEFYHRGSARHLLISVHPEHYRVHFTTRRESVPQTPPTFCATLRSRLKEMTFESLKMKASDRVLVLEIGSHRLIAELMGKHSNLILIDEDAKVVSAIKWVGPTKSKRPILPGKEYLWPPVLKSNPDLTEFSFSSLLGGVHSNWSSDDRKFFNPGFSASQGAYPLDLSDHFLDWVSRDSISIALESYYSIRIPAAEAEVARRGLTVQLDRVLLARETALKGLYEARDSEGKAGRWQRFGELLLAYSNQVPVSASSFETLDYDGAPLTIPLDFELSAKDNAQRFFEKAKKAKSRIGVVLDQIQRIEIERDDVESTLLRVMESTSLREIEELREFAKARRWLHTPTVSVRGIAERAYEGHRIKELLGPQNTTILYGENAEANDYLTLRVAKSNDWWLHVRGHSSAHVVIRTQNKPDLISRQTLEYAAKIAVQQSPQKHAGYVAVDYTLKKYVRKPKGAPKGTALYTHEKTIHVGE
jgi:predicted ribosome quality control (RQC) complex YloA/Tae2 family protein